MHHYRFHHPDFNANVTVQGLKSHWLVRATTFDDPLKIICRQDVGLFQNRGKQNGSKAV
jgi:hypothetical protein